MPVFRIRTKHPSGEFRQVSVSADSEDEAVFIVEGQERDHVGFQIDPREAASLEKKMREGSLSGRDKARLLSHQQDVPYKVQKADG